MTSSDNITYFSLYYLLLPTYYCNFDNPYYHQNDNACYDRCPNRTFADLSSLTCKDCPFDCSRCDAQGNCLACKAELDHRKLFGTRCVPVSGYFESGSFVALPCPEGCSHCSSLFACTGCFPDYTLKDEACKNLGNPIILDMLLLFIGLLAGMLLCFGLKMIHNKCNNSRGRVVEETHGTENDVQR